MTQDTFVFPEDIIFRKLLLLLNRFKMLNLLQYSHERAQCKRADFESYALAYTSINNLEK